MNWYCAQTYTGRELAARDFLLSRKIDAFLPQIKEDRKTRHRAYTLKTAYFRGYLFVNSSLESYRLALESRFGMVLRLVRFGMEPALVPVEVIEAIMARCDAQGFICDEVTAQSIVKPQAVIKFSPRQAIAVNGGPFEGFEGLFVRDAGDRVYALLRTFDYSGAIVEKSVQVERRFVVPSYAVA